MEKLAGVFCAFWTPSDDRGEILWPAFERNLEFVLRAGVHGIMALGSTGEFPQLSPAQRKAALEKIIAACRRHGNRPVIANVSDVSHRQAIDLARHAKASGAAMAAVLPPWFFPIEQRDLAEFFIAIGRAADLPLGLYNFPEVARAKIELPTIEAVARQVRVAAVKQSGAEFSYHQPLLELGRRLGFSVLTGADTRFAEALALGCAGTVSGLANAVPEPLVSIFHHFQAGRDSSAETRLVSAVESGMAPLFFPWNVKAAIAARGLETGEPKNPASPETWETYRRTVSQLSPVLRGTLPAIASTTL